MGMNRTEDAILAQIKHLNIKLKLCTLAVVGWREGEKMQTIVTE